METQQISEYITGPLSSKGAGCSLWGFCKKEGSEHEYFIKQFTKHQRPSDSAPLPADLIKEIQEECDIFSSGRQNIYSVLLSNCRTGNIVVIQDFFLNGVNYYVVTDKVEDAKSDVHLVSRMDEGEKRVFLAALVYSIAKLHERGIVHADLKPDNILLKKTKKGGYAPKIIDFDGSFFIKELGNVNGDQVYLSPEFALKLNGEDVKLTEKLDIFALGILIHQYWTGEQPKFDKEKYGYVHEAVLDGSSVTLSSDLPPELREPVRKMLSKEPDDRPSAAEIHRILLSNGSGLRKPEPESTPSSDTGGFGPI